MNASPPRRATNSSAGSRISAAVRDALEAKLGAPKSASIVFRPQNMAPVTDETGESLVKLLDVLDDHDDVQNVYGNYELSDALDGKDVRLRLPPGRPHCADH